jgi:alpha-beta hydrolase superfamily lysophospholipase
MGALVALDFIAQRSPTLAGLIVTNPYTALALDPPKAKLLLGKAAAFVAPKLSLPSGLPPEAISRDPTMVEAYRSDPLGFATANASWFRESNGAMERVRRMKAVSMPLLFAYSMSDPIAKGSVNRELAQQLASPDKTVIEREGLHEILNETDRASLHDLIRDWILTRSG